MATEFRPARFGELYLREYTNMVQRNRAWKRRVLCLGLVRAGRYAFSLRTEVRTDIAISAFPAGQAAQASSVHVPNTVKGCQF